MAKVVSEYRQLGEIGIIADYWESYISSCTDPETIKATPHDKAGIRSQELVDRVFEQKNLYVIKNLWMDDFPDTLEQFGYILVKDGTPFHLGAGDLCKYKKVKVYKVFPYTLLDFDKAQEIMDLSVGRMALFASPSGNIPGNGLLVRGPDIPVGIGDFTSRFWLRADNATHDQAIAKLEVTADNGTTLLASRKLTMDDFNTDGYISVDVDFHTATRINHVEFRICYYGHADLYFTHAVLMEK